jgi:hypothetical protein
VVASFRSKLALAFFTIIAASNGGLLAAPGESLVLPGDETFDETSTEETKTPTLTKPDIIRQLRRENGQTEFLSPSTHSHGGAKMMLASASFESAGLAAPERAEQRADVFKFRKAANGHLQIITLNNLRGLLVTDLGLSEGANASEFSVLGRTEPTLNNPIDLYTHPTDSNRVIVLEHDRETNRGRILVYNLQDPTLPVLEQQIPLEGKIADHVIVGNAFYVATTQSNEYSGEGTGKLTSYVLQIPEKMEIDPANPVPRVPATKVAELDFTIPVDLRGNNLGIERLSDGRYFMTVILGKDVYRGETGSTLSIVNITDPEGKLKHIMNVTTSGRVNREQISIQGDYVITTSNITSKGDGKTGISTAVYRFPAPGDYPLSLVQETYRVAKVAALTEHQHGRPLVLRTQELIGDPKEGLKGKFFAHPVRDNDGNVERNELVKLVPDEVINVFGEKRKADGEPNRDGESGNRQNLQLTSVKYAQGDARGEFDVFVAPGELRRFKVSKDGKKLETLGKVTTEEWVERHVSFAYEGRRFLVGLGKIFNATEEAGLARLQIGLYEIAGTETRQVASLQVSDVDAEFSGEEHRVIKVELAADGKGAILFQGRQSKQYQEGGQYIGFDLAQVGKTADVLSVGAFIPGDRRWLSRAFTSEGGNLFLMSAYNLQVFGQGARAASLRGEAVEAMTNLELARNIVATTTLDSVGIQIVTENSHSNGEEKSNLSIRFVDSRRMDSSHEIHPRLRLEGNFSEFVKSADGTEILILTNEYLASGERRNRVYKVAMQKNTPNLYKTAAWDINLNSREATPQNVLRASDNYSSSLSEIGKGRYLVQASGQVVEIYSEGLGTVLEVKVENLTRRKNSKLSVVNGTVILSSSEQVRDPELRGAFYERHFIEVLIPSADFNTAWKKGPKINIPGEIAHIWDKNIVTRDKWWIANQTDNYQGELHFAGSVSDTGLTLLNLSGILSESEKATATLFDKLALSPSELGMMHQISDGFILWKNSERPEVMPFSSHASRMPMPPRHDSEPRLQTIRVLGGYNRFDTVSSYVDGLTISGAQLSQIHHDPSLDILLGVFSSGANTQIASWNASDRYPNPVVEQVRRLDTRFTPGEPVTEFKTFGHGASESHYDSANGSFSLPSGAYGICQVNLAKFVAQVDKAD